MEDKAWRNCNILAMAIGEIIQERARQDIKWGADVERIPSIAERNIAGWLMPMAPIVKLYEQQERAAGRESMFMTAIEELAEAGEAAWKHGSDSPELLRELVQCGAVIIKWIEAIQRRRHTQETFPLPQSRRVWRVYNPNDEFDENYVFALSEEEALAKVKEHYHPDAWAELRAASANTLSHNHDPLLAQMDKIAEDAMRDMLGALLRGMGEAGG